MLKTDPIGIFDSGVGGLTVVKSLLEKMPGESFIYFGDTAHVPYGEKSREQILSYAARIMDFLLAQDVKAIAVACGTHSSISLPQIADRYNLPVVGVVEAGARQAAVSTRNNKIGIVATQATVNTGSFTKSLKRLNKDLNIYEMACPLLVPLVESGKLTGEETEEAIKKYFDPLIARQIDSVVLGCTHYPFLIPAIKKYTGDRIMLIDAAGETIEELKAILSARNLLNDSEEKPSRKFYVSGEDSSFYKVGKLLIGDVIKEVKKVELNW